MVVFGLVFLVFVTSVSLVVFALFVRVPGSSFDSAGMPIHYTDEGTGTPVLLVHGFGLQADLNWRWTGCIRRLRKAGYRVVALDVRGHGRSGKSHAPQDYGVALSDDIVRLLDHLGIAKAHLIGYSMGGFIVLKTVERHPDRLLSGVIGAAGWGLLDETYLNLIQEIIAAMDTRRSFDPLTDWLDENKHAPWLNRFLANFFMRSMNDLDAIVNVFKTFDALSVGEDGLRRNAVPVLTVVGDRDGIRETSERLPGLMAHHKLVYIPGGDHINTLLRRGFMLNILAFLKRHGPDGSV